MEATGVPSPPQLGMVDFKAIAGMMGGVRVFQVFGLWSSGGWLGRPGTVPCTLFMATARPQRAMLLPTKPLKRSSALQALMSHCLSANSLHLFRRRITVSDLGSGALGAMCIAASTAAEDICCHMPLPPPFAILGVVWLNTAPHPSNSMLRRRRFGAIKGHLGGWSR